MATDQRRKSDIPESQWQEIIRRAQKVRALTNSPNVNEAAVAAAKLQELLFSYNLTLAEIEPTKSAAPESYTNEIVDLGFEMGDTGDWRHLLLSRIARYNFCRTIIITGSSTSSIIGEPHNITMVLHLYDYLSHEIVRLAKRDWKQRYARTPRTRDDAVRWVRPYCQGAVVSVGERLRAQFEASQGVNKQSTALVVVKDRQLNDAVRRYYPSTSDLNYDWQDRHAGYVAGVKAGREINLDKQLQGEAVQQLPSSANGGVK